MLASLVIMTLITIFLAFSVMKADDTLAAKEREINQYKQDIRGLKGEVAILESKLLSQKDG